MSILISVAFSLLMVTPISLVAIATAISLNGLGSGAANLGIVAACYFLIWLIASQFYWCKCSFTHRSCKNDDPSLLEKFNYFDTIDYKWNNYWNHLVLQVKGTPLSAGFGYTGLVGPINAFNRMSGDPTMNIIFWHLGYFVIPFVSAYSS